MSIIFSQASGVADSIFGKSQEPIKAIITEQVEAFQQVSVIEHLFFMDKSKNFAEKYTIETSLGDFEPVGENGAYPKTSIQEGFAKTIEPETWKSSFEVTQEMIEDAKIGKIKSRAKQFTTSYGRTREKYAANLIAAGIGKTMTIKGKTFDVTCADGKPMFSARHPSAIPGKKFVQSNLFKAAFNRKVLNKVQEMMQKFADDDGNLLNVMPDTIIIPNDGELKDLIYAAVGSELDPNTNNNAWNFQVGLWNVIVWNYLPATLNGEPYFIMADSKFLQDYMCVPFVDRVDLTVASYIDENTDANVFKGRARFAAGFNNWRGMALCGAGMAEGTDLTALNAEDTEDTSGGGGGDTTPEENGGDGGGTNPEENGGEQEE